MARTEPFQRETGTAAFNPPANRLSDIWRAQMHWPRYLEVNPRQGMSGFRLLGAIPTLTKEAMHAAVSMANKCEF